MAGSPFGSGSPFAGVSSSADAGSPQSAARAGAHLAPGDVRYIALEGGGGKGFAYLGAIQVLESTKPNVLKQLKGVAGTSAGAITALMLAMGLTAAEIEEQTKVDFNAFFDPPQPRLIPQPCLTADCTYGSRTDSTLEKAILAGTLDPKTISDLLDDIKQGNNVLDAYQALVFSGLVNLVKLRSTIEQMLSTLAPPVGNIVSHLNAYLAYLSRDMGFFSGAAARNYLDALIAQTASKRLGGPSSRYTNMPFVVFQKVFERELMVCGANFSTGKTVLFSPRRQHTPYFPVADAVRISMSLPLVFKPYVIDRQIPGWPPCGTYIDGGFWNNLPFTLIDPAGPQNRKTLGLRLEIDTPQKVRSSGDVLLKMANGIAGAGEANVLHEYDPMIVMLDTTDLSLLNFSPGADVKGPVTKRSRRAMRQYFGLPIPSQDQDAADDQRVLALQSQSICGT